MINIINRMHKTIRECENCGYRFSYGEEDIRSYNIYAANPLKATIHYVECPKCGKQHKINKERRDRK